MGGLIRNATLLGTADDRPDDRLDIRFGDGLIEEIGPQLPANGAREFDASGMIVSPALIDLHTHIYWGATSLGVRAEAVAARSGTGTFVDAGSAGAGNFAGFRTFIAEATALRAFAFLNISFAGIFGFGKTIMVGEGEIARLIDADTCLEIAGQNLDIVVGIKVRAGRKASGKNGTLAMETGRTVADKLGIPLMCHVDISPPSMSECLAYLRKGDILTHCSRPAPNSAVGDDGDIRPALREALDRGVLLDVGHGMGSYDFNVSRAMLEAGIAPHTISSDVHAQCIDGPAYDQLTTLNKMLTLGMPLKNAFAACTSAPAAIIGHPELGTLRPGTPADMAIFSWSDEPRRFVDSKGQSLMGKKHLECKGLFVAGEIIGPAQR